MQKLFLLGSILILAAVFFFIYQPNMKKKAELKDQNVVLKARVMDLRAKDAQREEKEKEILSFNDQIMENSMKYASGFSTEKDIMFVISLEEAADMTVSQISFGSTELFYLNKGINNGDTPATEGVEESTETPAETTTDEMIEGQILEQEDYDKLMVQVALGEYSLVGTKSLLTLSYNTTYDGLKKAIDYINNYNEKMTLNSVKATYDSTTGNLSGDIEIIQYSIAGNEKTYEAPVISEIRTGKDDIFNSQGFTTKNKKNK